MLVIEFTDRLSAILVPSGVGEGDGEGDHLSFRFVRREGEDRLRLSVSSDAPFVFYERVFLSDSLHFSPLSGCENKGGNRNVRSKTVPRRVVYRRHGDSHDTQPGKSAREGQRLCYLTS